MDMTSTAEAAARSWYDNPRLVGGCSPQTNGLGAAAAAGLGHHSLSGGLGGASAGSNGLGGGGGAVGSGAGSGGSSAVASSGLGLDTSDMGAFYALESNGHHRRYYSSYHQHSK